MDLESAGKTGGKRAPKLRERASARSGTALLLNYHSLVKRFNFELKRLLHCLVHRVMRTKPQLKVGHNFLSRNCRQVWQELVNLGGFTWITQASKELDLEASMSLTGDVIRWANGTELQLFPASEGHVQEHRNGTRRRLGVFRQCSPCTCCDKTRRWCLPTVCCYNIRCGLQGLPYGLCSFIPISCTCFGCRKWTFIQNILKENIYRSGWEFRSQG